MSASGSPEPIDFDFFAEDDDDDVVDFGREHRGLHSLPNDSSSRPVSGRKPRRTAAVGSAIRRDEQHDTDRDSVLSAGSSRSSIQVKIPSAGPTGIRENSYSRGGYLDSSDDEIERLVNKNKFAKQTNVNNFRPTASGTELGNGRPKTSKGSRRRKDSSSSNSSSSSKSNKSHNTCSSKDDSYTSISESDSDVTDVSPLGSPARSLTPRLGYDQDEFGDGIKDPNATGDSRESRRIASNKKLRKKESVRFTGVTPNGSTSQRDRRLDETEARELSRLLRAVLELDDGPKCPQLNSTHPQGRGNRMRMAAPLPAQPMPHQRVNMSFSNDKVRQIDRDNQRLLRRILGQSKSGSSVSDAPPARRRGEVVTRKKTSHSAIERERQQRKIEMENRKILGRIEAARASSAIDRNRLLHDHDKQMKYASQVSKSSMSARTTSSRLPGYSHSPGLRKGSSTASLASDVSHASSSSSVRGFRRARSSSGQSEQPLPPRGPRQAWDGRW